MDSEDPFNTGGVSGVSASIDTDDTNSNGILNNPNRGCPMPSSSGQNDALLTKTSPQDDQSEATTATSSTRRFSKRNSRSILSTCSSPETKYQVRSILFCVMNIKPLILPFIFRKNIILIRMILISSYFLDKINHDETVD
jgi:hypothetical protein